MSIWGHSSAAESKGRPVQQGTGDKGSSQMPGSHTGEPCGPRRNPRLGAQRKRTGLRASGRMWPSSLACLDWTHHWASGHWRADSGHGHPVPFWRSHILCEVVWFPVPRSHWCVSHPAGRPPARSPRPHTRSHWRRWGARPWPHPWGWPSCDSLQRREDSSVTQGTSVQCRKPTE